MVVNRRRQRPRSLACSSPNELATEGFSHERPGKAPAPGLCCSCRPAASRYGAGLFGCWHVHSDVDEFLATFRFEFLLSYPVRMVCCVCSCSSLVNPALPDTISALPGRHRHQQPQSETYWHEFIADSGAGKSLESISALVEQGIPESAFLPQSEIPPEMVWLAEDKSSVLMVRCLGPAHHTS